MGKYNKFDFGDVLGNYEIPDLIFQVIDIFWKIPERPENYQYSCREIVTINSDPFFLVNEIFDEEDLYFIRKADIDELNQLLQNKLAESNRIDDIIKSILENIKKLEE